MKEKRTLSSWILAIWIGILGSGSIFIWLWMRPATVLVQWETASELDTIGFYVTRSQSIDGPFERITATLIPSQVDAFSGGKYTYADRGLKPGTTYYYQLEAVSAQGEVERFGPLTVQANRINSWDGVLSALPAFSGLLVGIALRKETGKKLWSGSNLILLRVNKPELLNSLAQHYGEFITRRGKPDILVNVTLHYPAERSVGEAEPNISLQTDNNWFVETNGFKGQFNLERHKASLDLTSMQEAIDVDFFLRVLTLGLAYQQGGLLLHAAAIVRNEQAYVFLGHSGSGKTTCCRVSEKLPGIQVLNDDLVVLLPDASDWRVFSTPFWNQTQVKPGMPGQGIRLRKIYSLVKDEVVWSEAISQAIAIAEIIACMPAFGRLPEEMRSTLWKPVQKLAQTPGVKRLHFRKDATFWDVLDE
jgi:hypothetical protein